MLPVSATTALASLSSTSSHRRDFGEDLQAQVPPPCRCERCCIVGHPSFDFETSQFTRLNSFSLISYRISILVPFVCALPLPHLDGALGAPGLYLFVVLRTQAGP